MNLILLLFVSLLASSAVSRTLQPPLYTRGGAIIDSAGPVTLFGASWYGAEEMDYVVGGLDHSLLDEIVQKLVQMELNSVRVPYSNAMVHHWDQLVNSTLIDKNPHLAGFSVGQVFDSVISALNEARIGIILDNHSTDAIWCCTTTDGNGLWYKEAFSEQDWLDDWEFMVKRYKSNQFLIGVDLRNELRDNCTSGDLGDCLKPDWGSGMQKTDWRLAAARAANVLLSIKSDLLVFVEGLSYATDLSPVANYPITPLIYRPQQVVYSFHAYAWDFSGMACPDIMALLDKRIGFITTVPLWMGEFGTCNTQRDCTEPSSDQGKWWKCLLNWVSQRHKGSLGLSYWALNGSQSRGKGRTYNAKETYGMLDVNWSEIYWPIVRDLQNITLG